jgi:DNA-binding LacI/PurR family transcriptional regulator
VSYVMNPATRDRISAATRDRVLAAVAELGYAPHQAARVLRAGHSNIALIAFPYGPLSAPIVAENLDAFARELGAVGYTPLLHPRWPTSQEDLIDACLHVHPVVVVAPADLLSKKFVQTLRMYGAAAVLAVGEQPRPHVATLVFEQKRVGHLAIEYLAAVKRRRVLMLALDREEVAETRRLRVVGASSAADELGVELQVADVVADAESVTDALHTALARKRRPTGIYAFSDEIGIFALCALREMGVAVPTEVSVIGCDDTFAGAHVQPALTTIAFRSPEIWPAVASMLHAMVEGRRTKRQIELGRPVIVRREST